RELAATDTACGRLLRTSPGLRALAGPPAPGRARQDPRALPGTRTATAARERLGDDLAALLRTAAAEQPLLLVLDDVHEADASALQLLRELAAALHTAPVLLLATARDDDGAWRGRTAERAGLLRAGRVLPIGPLTEADVRALRAAAGAATPVRALLDRTGGEAFFVTELLRQGSGSGAGGGAALPTSVRAAVAARVAELPGECARTLGAAAVLGTRFDLDVLAEVAAVRLESLRDLLAPAAADGLLALVEPGCGAFRHDLMREAVYDTLTPAERAALHARAGTILATLAERGRTTGPAEAAHHLLLAGPEHAPHAVDLATHAAEQAATLLAFEAAAHWYTRALTALAPHPGPTSPAPALTVGTPTPPSPGAASREAPPGADASAPLLFDAETDLASPAAAGPEAGPALAAGPASTAAAAERSALARRAELLVGLGTVWLGAGERGQAREAFLAAAAPARRAGRPDLLARAALGLGSGPAGFEVDLLDRAQIDLLTEARTRLLDEGRSAVGPAGPRLPARGEGPRAAAPDPHPSLPDEGPHAAAADPRPSPLGEGPRVAATAAPHLPPLGDRSPADAHLPPLGDRPSTAPYLPPLDDRSPTDAHLPLLAAVTARLSVAASQLASDRERLVLAEEAVHVARAAGDAAVLGYALSALCDARAGPADCAARRGWAEEIVALARSLPEPDRELELLGRRLRLVALLELGRLADVDAEIRAYQAGARALDRPLYSWYVPLWRGMRALLEWRVEDCRAALAETEALGRRADSANAAVLAATQRWCLLAESGGPPEEVAALLDAVAALEAEPGVWPRVTLALLAAQRGDLAEAGNRLAAVGPLLSGAPVDSEWLPMLAQVAETLALLGSSAPDGATGLARTVYDALAPYAGLLVVEGIGAAVRGPVDRHLGLLATVLGERPAAQRHFATALATAHALGAARLAERITHESAPAEPPATARSDGDQLFVLQGELWQIRFAGQEVRLPDSKGLRDLAVLLARPGTPVPALDLATTAPSAPSALGARADDLHEPADTGELIDATARAAYRHRLTELDREAADADAAGDAERSARIAVERDALVGQLAAAYGLGGRVRRTGSAAERARTAVTARIRTAIERIARAHPALGRHLVNAVHTGTLCVYRPEQPVRWHT
ncbi:AAA family ATPase, partial [Kitasatospora sp. NPDC093806]|uniref:AAA family ATPase n=1 Tax=Kitasatospora sp. NPDC093806 TaxID=3155075 RepID=UPI0034347B23